MIILKNGLIECDVHDSSNIVFDLELGVTCEHCVAEKVAKIVYSELQNIGRKVTKQESEIPF